MASSLRLAKRLQILREQCRVFSSSSASLNPAENIPNADVLSLLSSAQSRNAPKPAGRPKPGKQQSAAQTRLSYLSSQLVNTRRGPSNMAARIRASELDNSHTRRYVPGDVISPHDLSFQETEKWRFNPKKRPQYDVFDVLGMDPEAQWSNFTVLGQFMTDMGRIRGKSQTGLNAKNQRKIAKAIRRSIGTGMHPSVHRHPELLEIQYAVDNRKAFWRR